MEAWSNSIVHPSGTFRSSLTIGVKHSALDETSAEE